VVVTASAEKLLPVVFGKERLPCADLKPVPAKHGTGFLLNTQTFSNPPQNTQKGRAIAAPASLLLILSSLRLPALNFFPTFDNISRHAINFKHKTWVANGFARHATVYVMRTQTERN
jgi:hypothetical protein